MLTSCDPLSLDGNAHLYWLQNPGTSTCSFIFLFEPKLVVSAIPTGFRAGLFGPAQQGRTGPGRRPLMLSSICDWKPGKCTFLVPHNSNFDRKTMGFEHNSSEPLISTFALPPGFCGENWGYAELNRTNQVDISRAPRLSFFLSLTPPGRRAARPQGLDAEYAERGFRAARRGKHTRQEQESSK